MLPFSPCCVWVSLPARHGLVFPHGSGSRGAYVPGSPPDTYALRDENGNDTNYLKLRDVAHVLNGSAAQFDAGQYLGIRVDWDSSAGAIVIDTTKP